MNVGRVAWSDLTKGQKATRIAAGVAATAAVASVVLAGVKGKDVFATTKGETKKFLKPAFEAVKAGYKKIGDEIAKFAKTGFEKVKGLFAKTKETVQDAVAKE